MASIGDINNLQDKENLDIGLVPTHYFDAQGNKRNIAEDVAAIYQAINGKAASSHTHGTGDITGLDNTLNGRPRTQGQRRPHAFDSRGP